MGTTNHTKPNPDGAGTVSVTLPLPPEVKVKDESISLTPYPSFTLTGGGKYNFESGVDDHGVVKGVKIEPADIGWTINSDGLVTGTMPDKAVTVKYKYKQAQGEIRFNSNGGTPEEIQPLMGAIGTPIDGVRPNVGRYGYKFLGWSKSGHGPVIGSWHEAYPHGFPEDPVELKAVYEVDTGVTFDYTVDYVNEDGSIVFQTSTTSPGYSVEHPVTSAEKNIHGYKWEKNISSLNPATYNFGMGVENKHWDKETCFNANTGAFSGNMPGQDASVRYRYKVDRNNPSATSPFTVEYVTTNGTVIHAADTHSVFPEDPITVTPVDVYIPTYIVEAIHGQVHAVFPFGSPGI